MKNIESLEQISDRLNMCVAELSEYDEITPKDYKSIYQVSVDVERLIDNMKMHSITNKNHLKTLADNCWSLICEDLGESEYRWIVVGYFMGDKPQRVIGESYDENKPELAIEDALKTIEGDSYAYKYEYVPEK